MGECGKPMDLRTHTATINFTVNGLVKPPTGDLRWGTHKDPNLPDPGTVDIEVSLPWLCVKNDDNNKVTSDIALIQLDDRIPSTAATPKHIPGLAPSGDVQICANAFGGEMWKGYVFGYAPNEWRLWAQPEDWSREGAQHGAVWQKKYWYQSYDQGTAYGATEPGDSGGPLLGPDWRLCGVCSGYNHTSLSPWTWVHYAAVDTPEAVAFLSRVVDYRGQFAGECPGDDTDSDHDLLPDSCDLCPTHNNPGYRVATFADPGAFHEETDPRSGQITYPDCCPRKYFELAAVAGYDAAALDKADSDTDGIPDLCDTCPNKENKNQRHEAEPDTDEDGIPDLCDLCPTVATLPPPSVDKLLMPIYQEDNDGDGVGTVCDWCEEPGAVNQVKVQELHDCNFEAELSIYNESRPGEWNTAAPTIKASDPEYADKLAKYHAAFRLGTCDPAPCPTIALSLGAFTPGNVPDKPCIGPTPDFHCGFVVNNMIQYTPKAMDPAPILSTGRTHAKYCDCPGLDVNSVEGRVACASTWGCVALATTFDTGYWWDIKTATWNVNTTSFEWWPLPGDETALTFKDGIAIVRQSYWDYWDLPFTVWKTPNDPVKSSIHGVLWSNTRSFFQKPADVMQKRGTSLTGGAAAAWPDMTFNETTLPWDFSMKFPCKECGIDVGDLLVRPGPMEYPGWLVKSSGPQPAPGSVAAGLGDTIHAALAAGQKAIFPAEPLGVVETTQPGRVVPRALFLDPVLRMPVTSLDAASLSGTITARPLADRPPVDTLPSGMLSAARTNAPAGSDGIVFSASRMKLYQFGGDSSAQASAWSYDLRLFTWTETPLLAEGRPGHVLAGTYRLQDGLVYDIDRADGQKTIVLRRWSPGADHFDVLGTFPVPWHNFTTFYLVPNELGDLFVVATRDQHSVIARLKVSTTGQVQFAGIWIGNEVILAQPYAGLDRIGFSVRRSGTSHPIYVERLVACDEFKLVPKGWAPTLMP